MYHCPKPGNSDKATKNERKKIMCRTEMNLAPAEH